MPDPHVPVINEGQDTPATQEITSQERKAGTIPPGTYDAELREVAIVKRKRDGSHVLRLLCRTTDLGRHVIAWQGLSDNPRDPWDLTPGQWRGLQRIADRLGVPSTGGPAETVGRIATGLLGGRVTVSVKRTPVGQAVTVTRDLPLVAEDNVIVREAQTIGFTAPVVSSEGFDVNGDPIVVHDHNATPNPADQLHDEILDAAENAHRAHVKVLEGLRGVRLSLALVAEGCHELHVSEGWRDLGYGSLSEYLAAPEITISRTEFYALAAIWRGYVLDGGVPPTELQGAERSKLEVPLPALSAGVVSADVAVADATAMPRSDLRAHYAVLMGEGEPAPRKRRPVEITDEMVERGVRVLGRHFGEAPTFHVSVVQDVLRAALNPNEEPTA